MSTTLGVDDGLTLVFGSFMAKHLVVAAVLDFVLLLLIATFLWSRNGHRPTVALSCVLGVTTLIAITASFGTWWLPAAAAQL